MPYIKKSGRVAIDIHIDTIVAHLRTLELDEREGVCNYAITRIVTGGLKPPGGWRYKWLNRACGVFTAAAAEFYRRLVAPYEDACIQKNGDLEEYERKV
jgi:hypothetical protein